jgi:hypothetical protein
MKYGLELNQIIKREVESFCAENNVTLNESADSKIEAVSAEIQDNVDTVLGKTLAEVSTDNIITEEMAEVEVGAVLGVTEDFEFEKDDGSTIVVPTGSFMVLNAGESDEEFSVDIYDESSSLIEGGVVLTASDLDDLVSSGYAEEIPQDSMTLESVAEEVAGIPVNEVFVKFSHGKIKKFQLKPKKGYKRVGTSYVKLSASALSKMRKNAAKMGKKKQTSASKMMRRKTMKIRKAKVHAGVDMSAGYMVKEGFDLENGNKVHPLETNDIIKFQLNENKEITLTVSRKDIEIFKDIPVEERFINECLSEMLIENVGEEVKPDEVLDPKPDATEEVLDPKPDTTEEVKPDATEEVKPDATEEVKPDATEEVKPDAIEETKVVESVLKYNSQKGYVLVKDGNVQTLGNRVRARALLINEGFTVTSVILDSAFNGKDVIL